MGTSSSIPAFPEPVPSLPHCVRDRPKPAKEGMNTPSPFRDPLLCQGWTESSVNPSVSELIPHISVRGCQFACWAWAGMQDVSAGAGLCPAPASPAWLLCHEQCQAAVMVEHTLLSSWLALDAPDAAGQQAHRQRLAQGLPKPERNRTAVLGM